MPQPPPTHSVQTSNAIHVFFFSQTEEALDHHGPAAAAASCSLAALQQQQKQTRPGPHSTLKLLPPTPND
jgi:hypothetical protein